MVLPDSRRVPRAPRYSGTAGTLRQFRLRASHPLWSAFPNASAIVSASLYGGPTTPERLALRFGLFPLRSPLLGESIFLSLPWVLRCFSSPRLASHGLFHSSADARVYPGGLPHSEISGSQLVYSSPKLIAVSHVLHRLLTP